MRDSLEMRSIAFTAARNDDVHVVFHGDQFTDRGTVGGFDHLDRGFR